MKKSYIKWIMVLLISLIADRLTKIYISQSLELGQSNTVINNFFYISHIKNRGAAWGIMQNGRFLFLTLTIIALAFMVYYFVKVNNNFFKLSMSLLIGGALGNFIDRAIWGEVTDFLEFHFGSYIFPIFNIADICVVSGTIALAIYILFIKENEVMKQNFI